ncbi:hypothetical protein HJG60_009301 [Phyllostomus discolor]|uniref:Uncharacterized protein n=1 Tax=Phyllostomus discolor TaxID=89673 RepID=A0A833YIH8_9CHIR|nr:hypothetical protein HJG60_009301 [Phyllostomus discolor]
MEERRQGAWELLCSPLCRLCPPPEQLIQEMGFVLGEGCWNVTWGIWILSVFPIQVPEGGRGQAMEVPHPHTRQSPTLLGFLLGPGQGESKCVAVDLFSIFLFVLYGDAFLVFYTIRKEKVLDILMSFVGKLFHYICCKEVYY